MKLELKHLAPYLPYGVQYARITDSAVTLKKEVKIIGELSTKGNIHNIHNNVLGDYTNFQYLPILRPLSDITKFKDIMDEFSENSWEIFENAFFVFGRSLNCFDTINYTISELCFKHHLDIFGLIEQGLAIDINTLKP